MQALGYRLYHFQGKLPTQLQANLMYQQGASCLKEALENTVKRASLRMELQGEYSARTDLSSLRQYIIFQYFFIGSVLEQVYLLVPVDNALPMKEENTKNFRTRISKECEEKIKAAFGNYYVAEQFHLVGSFITVLKDEKVFSDNKLHYSAISQFVTGSYQIEEEQYMLLEPYQILIGYEGVGVIAPTESDLKQIDEFIIAFLLTRAYLAALEQISLRVVDFWEYEENEFTQRLQELETVLDEYTGFLMRYYYPDPIRIEACKTFHLYGTIKKELRLWEGYQQSKEQLHWLAGIVARKKGLLEEKAVVNIRDDSSPLQLESLHQLMVRMKLWLKWGISVLVAELFILLILVFSLK
ncbi:MAG: hypothetical protein WDW21_03755 [Neisseriaceae bacterium]